MVTFLILLLAGTFTFGVATVQLVGAPILFGELIKMYAKGKGGYKPGEGPLTPRYNGLGVYILREACELGSFLATAAETIPQLQPFIGDHFDLTVSEGNDLMELCNPLRSVVTEQGLRMQALQEALRKQAEFAGEGLCPELELLAGQKRQDVHTAIAVGHYLGMMRGVCLNRKVL